MPASKPLAATPVLKPAGEFLESIRIQARGTNVTGTAKIKDITNVLMMAFFSFASPDRALDDPFEDDLGVGPIEIIEETEPALLRPRGVDPFGE